MQDNETVVFHFLDNDLYFKFIEEIEPNTFISLIKRNHKLCSQMFTGCRVNSQSLKIPKVRKKLKEFALKEQALRNFLGFSWFISRKALIIQTFSLTPFDIEYNDNGNWFAELKNIEKKIGFDVLINKIISALVFSNADVDDIKIFVSLLSVEYKDQANLEDQIDTLIDACEENPTPFIKEIINRIEKEKKGKNEIIGLKEAIEKNLDEYKEELYNNREIFKNDKAKYHKEIAEKVNHEKDVQDTLSKYKEDIKQIELKLQKAEQDRKEAETREKKATQKNDYEQVKLREVIKELKDKGSQIDVDIENINKAINDKAKLIEELKKRAKAKERETKSKFLTKKGLNGVREKEPKPNKDFTTFEIREELEKINTVLGRIEPLIMNEKGFISTPSTLDIFELLYTDKLNPPNEPPAIVTPDSDILEHIHYYKYKAFWDTDKWDQNSIIRYSYWKSKMQQDHKNELSAEIALSGVYHAEKLKSEADEIILLYRFLCAVGNLCCKELYEPISDEQVFQALESVAEQAEKNSLVTCFLGQLSFTLPKTLDFLFDIANPRVRVLLKRCLSTIFHGFLSIDERDPSHEILHLINTISETYDTKMRSACGRWLMQDSIDAIAQNARNEIMALLAKFPDIGRTKSKFVLDDFKTHVSTPLSMAVSSGQPDAFEQLSKQCFLFSQKIIKDKNWLSSVYLLPCSIHLANLAAEANIQAKRLFRAALSIDTDKQHYPLNDPERRCPVEIVIKNIGNAEAKELKILIMPSNDFEEAYLHNGEPTFDNLFPNNVIRHTVNIKLSNPTHALNLDYILSWRDSSSMDERSQTGTLKLLSQRKVNWKDAQNPYSLKSIKDPDRLKGRSDILNILRRSRESMDSYYITGQRRTGKSSVAQVYYKELNDLANKGAIYLSWGDLGSVEIAPICHAVCYEFRRKMAERTNENKLHCPKLDDFKGNENFIFRTFFKEMHSYFSEWKFFIVIDDFDELPSSLHQTEKGDQFFTLLRALLDLEYLALYLVGSEKLPEILKRQGERLNLTQRCEIDYIKDFNEITKIITEPAGGILEFQDSAVEEIVRLSAGNPYYATLICGRLFNKMAQNKDYYVSKRDVQLSTEVMLEEDSLSTYQHFWKDGVFLPGRLGERQQYHNAKVLISLSRAQTAENQAVRKEDLMDRDDLSPITRQDAEYAISGLLDRKVIIEDADSFSIRVPLFAKWISKNGASAVERSFAETGLDEVPISVTRGLSTRDIINISQDLVFQDKEINEIQISDWLAQFGGITNQVIAYKLLKRLREQGYYSDSIKFRAFKELHKELIATEVTKSDFAQKAERKQFVNLIISYLDQTGKSGHACEYAYRRVNRIHSNCAVSPENLVSHIKNSKGKVPIIFTDDIVGTGGTISKGFRQFSKNMAEEGLDVSDYNIYLASITGTKVGIEFVNKETDGAIKILPWKEIDHQLHAFSENANIFKDEAERLAAKELVSEIGKELEPSHPLGRNDGQLLLAFQHGCPNNTLPIFYKTGRTYRGKEWRPLFPR